MFYEGILLICVFIRLIVISFDIHECKTYKSTPKFTPN